MKLNQSIREIRKALGLSQEELAHRLGSTVTTVSRYENGRKLTGKYLEGLIGLSEEAGRKDLKQVFVREKEKELALSMRRLKSKGTARQIPYWQLQSVAEWLIEIKNWFDIMEALSLEPSSKDEHDQNTFGLARIKIPRLLANLAETLLPLLGPAEQVKFKERWKRKPARMWALSEPDIEGRKSK